MSKKMRKYLSAHPMYNSAVHVVIGMGIGIILAWPIFLPHPVRWGILLIGLGIAGHLYPLWLKK